MNRGAKGLAKHCTEHGAQARLAAELGMDEGRLSRILSGKKLPTPLQRARIEDKYPEVGWRLWDEPVSESGEHAAVAATASSTGTDGETT